MAVRRCCGRFTPGSMAATSSSAPRRSGTDVALDPATIIAATSAIAAGPVGMIGNVITRPGMRGQGLGRAMMSVTLAWLRERGVRSVLLDATIDGQPLYQKLGFVAQERSWIAHATAADLDLVALQARAGSNHARLRPLDDLPAIAALDQAAFGGDRLELLRLVASTTDCWLYTAGDDAIRMAICSCARWSRRGGRAPRSLGGEDAGGWRGVAGGGVRHDTPWRAGIPEDDEPQVSFSTSAASARRCHCFKPSGERWNWTMS